MFIRTMRMNGSSCLICSDRASGIHFGVLTCEACKAFFRRTDLSSPSIPRPPCSPIRCSITVENRNTCPNCRFEKCQRAGMDRNNITFGKQRRQPATKIFDRLKEILSSFLTDEHFHSLTELLSELFPSSSSSPIRTKRLLDLIYDDRIEAFLRRSPSLDPLTSRALFFVFFVVSTNDDDCSTALKLLRSHSSPLEPSFSVDFVNTLTILANLE